MGGAASGARRPGIARRQRDKDLLVNCSDHGRGARSQVFQFVKKIEMGKERPRTHERRIKQIYVASPRNEERRRRVAAHQSTIAAVIPVLENERPVTHLHVATAQVNGPRGRVHHVGSHNIDARISRERLRQSDENVRVR